MLALRRIELREIRLRLKEPFRISSGVVAERRILLLQLEAADGGPHAWSECVAFERPNYSPETVETAWIALCEWIAPRLLGKMLASPSHTHSVLQNDLRGHAMAKAAVEMGVWALAAERSELPLARLLGGERDRIPVGVSLGIEATPDALVTKAMAAASQGYRRIKLKIAPGSDIAFVAAVREALPSAPLTVDANSAYTLAHSDVLGQLDRFGLLMIEQPLGDDDLVRHATLQRRLRTPVCLDESITSVERAEDMIHLGSGRIVNMKPGRVGGLAAATAIHDVCQQASIPVWCGGMLETGIGRAYNIALATLRGFTMPGDLSPSARYWERDIVIPEWTMTTDGMVDVPDRPGLGVIVDEGRIDDLTVRRATLLAS